MRIFISSTLRDLAEHREAVFKAVRLLGHQTEAMENWVASENAPLDRNLQEVRQSDALILLVAWRYGWIPPGQQVSITELELDAARAAGIPCFLFVVPSDAPWPASDFDADRSNVERFRKRLFEHHLVGYFTSPETLAKQVAVALHAWTSGRTAQPLPVSSDAIASADAPTAEVFVSYAREDIAVAEAVAERLAKEHWSVFWDRKIPVGMLWDDFIEAALDGAKCVVVLWSPSSTQSKWVKIEATEGEERGILAPGTIKETRIPLRFRRIQSANLVGWNGPMGETAGMVSLISAVRRCVRDRGDAA